jgi:cellulose synthase/poly-beta-1,6-N-acetylglucosamine synthase-like glycosyltransferase
MILCFQIVFFATAYLMIHTYVVYPFFLYILSRNRTPKNRIQYKPNDALPEIAVICAAYNEEVVIAEKIESIFNTTYPKEKVAFYIGTDACTDDTVVIIKKYQEKYSSLKLIEFTERTGKINIINKLCSLTQAPILIMTDANVYFKEDTFYELVKGFKDDKVKMVCGNICKRALNTETITQNELQYFNFENFIKSAESKLWNVVIGAEGGCYALRKENYSTIPSNFTVDDFFITCKVLSSKGEIVFQESALVYEDAKADTSGEFRRKARIATGNFQNLVYFKNLLQTPFSKIGFAYLSHKVFRWVTPFLFLLNSICCLCLANTCLLFKYVFIFQLIILLLPTMNKMLLKTGVKLKAITSLSHFIVMNFALFVGFIRYCKGVTSSVWQPVTR